VPPDRLVEAVIALSIAFVAAENLFLHPVVSRRWLVSFCFGLVHRFDFSSAVRELGLPTHGLLLSLFGFNAGVELGQALVVGPGPAGAGAGAGHALGAGHDLELVVGDPPRRRDPIRGTGVPLMQVQPWEGSSGVRPPPFT
jgi:hypothetical protein